MKYAVEMGKGAMIYIPNFIKIVSGILKLTGWTHIEPSLVCSRATLRPPALFPSLNPKLPSHSHS
jgi:hypothetical protein